MARLHRRVLVVDGDAGVRSMAALALLAEGHAVSLAARGQEALRLLEGWRPDLILLDPTMPSLDGRAFIAARRADQSLAAIPVIAMSAGPCPDYADALAPTAVLCKPFGIDELLETVARCLDG